MTILCPLLWTTCGVVKMSRIFQIVVSSQCHTTVTTARTSGCNAKVKSLEYSNKAIANHQNSLILVNEIVFTVPHAYLQKVFVRVVAMDKVV